jgi:hypothetical protein
MTHARTAPSSARLITRPSEVPSRFLAMVPPPDPPLSHAPLEARLDMCIALRVFEPRDQAAVMTGPTPPGLHRWGRDQRSSIRSLAGSSPKKMGMTALPSSTASRRASTAGGSRASGRWSASPSTRPARRVPGISGCNRGAGRPQRKPAVRPRLWNYHGHPDRAQWPSLRRLALERRDLRDPPPLTHHGETGGEGLAAGSVAKTDFCGKITK